MSDMNIKNSKIKVSKFLRDMYRDPYFPDFLVDKVRDIIVEACHEIESEKPDHLAGLYAITCRATDKINDLVEEFEDNESEIETAARESIAETFEHVAQAYGYSDADLEELIATRDW